jgi:hypothetical protein
MPHQFTAAVLMLVCAAAPAYAQAVEGLPSSTGDLALPSIEGPPPPTLPATMARDEDGRVTARAVKLTTPLRIDGQLDEALYSSYQPLTDFIQLEPAHGEPATEKSEVWIAFDADHVYLAFRASESEPERLVANEMRRDANSIWQSESLSFALDTFYDRRNSLNFYLNVVGGRMDGQVTNEGNWSSDWNPVWDFAVRRTAEGWTGEAAIPFKSIRYQAGRQQIWGLQIRRVNRWKNEQSYLTALPQGNAGNAIFRMSQAATLVGIEAPASGLALDIKPYVTSGLSTDFSATRQARNDFAKDVGLDVKYGLTRSLAADFTYNTDFAQVEADEQQVNLTRFSLFFPEKREFFLENAGIFNFGNAGNNFGGGNFTSDAPMLFYSRRIGLESGSIVPIEAGGRLSGRAGKYALGLINIQTDDVAQAGIPSTNFSVARVRRDVLRRSAIGAMATRRSNISGPSTSPGAGESYGVDGAFAFFTNLNIQAYWARTVTPGVHRGDTSYRGNLNFNGDRYGVQVEHLAIGDRFNPEVGFVRRDDFVKSRVNLRFSPRPMRRFRSVRKFSYSGQVEYFENRARRKEQREISGDFQIEFQRGDRFEMGHTDTWEFVPAPFAITRRVTVPTGGYDQRTFRSAYQFGQQRMTSGTVYAEYGAFYGGTRTAYGFTSGRVNVSPQLAFEPRVTVDRVTLPYGEFTSRLVSSRVTYTITPMMFVSGLLQYNRTSNSFSTNLRLRWEYLPGSELFVVYNDGRDTTPTGFPRLQNRALILKVNRLFRF